MEVNKQGFISSWSDENVHTNLPAYLVFFKDYSRLDPSCRLWDTSAPIDNIKLYDQSLSYTKEIESIQLNCNITLCENGWDWSIEIHDKYPLNHRLGIAAPIGKGSLECLGHPVQTPVAQYYRSSQEVFPDQTFLPIPILYCPESKCCIFCGISHDTQFFSYNDANERFVRTTVSTTISNSLMISFRVCSSEDLPKIYVEKHPKATKYIYTWKPVLEEISMQQNIEISYYFETSRLETPQGEILVKPPNENDIESYTKILNSALNRYPNGFLKSIGIDGIMMSGTIIVNKFKSSERVHSTRYSGIAFSKYDKSMKWIICDASLKQSWLIHHEIFHYLHDELELEDYPPGGRTWLSALTDDPIEQKCDLFASIMTNQRTWNNNDIRFKQAQCMEKALTKFDDRLSFCTESFFTESSDTKIWYIPDGKEPEQIDFGYMPEKINGIFVFDLNWYNER